MPNLPVGPELDRLVAVAMRGEATRSLAPYSTDGIAASRLLRRLGELGIAVEVEETEGQFYCTFRSSGERIATGSGETRELAVSRAVVICKFPSSPIPPPAKRAVRSALPGEPRYCDDCGEELARRGRRTTVARICNLCGWKRVKAQPPRQSQRPATP